MPLKYSFAFALVLSVTGATGCGLFASSGPTAVARGEYYSAGKPEFDGFFIQLHQLQVTLLAAPEEPRAARQNLTQAARVSAEASDQSLSTALTQELHKLAAQGLRVRLEVPEASADPAASATLHSSDSTSNAPLRSVLPREATRLVRSRNGMIAAEQQLEKLGVAGIQLEGSIDQAFRVDGPWKRDEVRRNLQDGQKLLILMAARAQAVREQDVALLALLSKAATTDASLGKAASYSPPPATEAPPPPKPGKRPPPHGSAAAKPGASKPAAAPAAAAKPPAKPKGEDDAPAPKPVQGSAPAEIEP